MHALKPSYFKVAAPLLSQLKPHTVIRTILSGETPGRIYVDDPVNPALAFAQFRHRAFIAGDHASITRKDLAAFFQTTIFENCRAWDVPLFRLAAGSPQWFDWVKLSLMTLDPIQAVYRFYEYKIRHLPHLIDIPEGFSIKTVDSDLIAGIFEGKDDLLEEMCSERETVQAFLAKSFGVAAFHGEALAGWCLSEYNHGDRCEVGIATHPPFQKQGLAKAMTGAFLQLAANHGIKTILWHCYRSNEASWRTALSAGFALLREEPVLMVYLDRALNAAVHGNLAFENQEFETAMGWYQKALSGNQPQAWMAWNAACAAAHTGQTHLAFDCLHRAIDLGFQDLDYLVKSEHLSVLKNEKRWGEIITHINKAIHTISG